ncbi:SoxW family protein [Hansschlegelia zhihuaiae]|uniref:SoxW family protein n=1 Tax=Hansschlegelia zhihuaiae TaxID=405005 RepID=UPI001FE0FDFB|nr:thioredoxin family protein [Hansschlegelia zhihuaiae]
MTRRIGPDRRAFLGLGVGASLAATTGSRAASVLGDDGNYVQDWYVDSFLDLGEDAQAALGKGKGFATQWGMRGCPACKRLHTVYFAEPGIEGFVREKFEIVHLDTFGSREVTDIDGERLGEKALAAKRAVRTTPTFQFFAMQGGRIAEVARMPGLLGEREFLAMFRFVAEGGYTGRSFEEWLKAQQAR